MVRTRFRGARLSPTAAILLVITATVGGPATWSPPAARAAAATGTLPAAPTVAVPGPVKPGVSQVVDASAALAFTPADGTRPVFIQLTGPGAATVYDAERQAEATAAGAQLAARARRAVIDRATSAVLAELTAADPSTQSLFRVGNAVPGLGVAVSGAALLKIAARGDVARISPLVPKTTAGIAPATRAAALQRTVDSADVAPAAGHGVRIGIVDTGIDYTHADFGGAASSAAFGRAQAARQLVPTAKVVGGYDFVGDQYDASAQPVAGAADPRIPHPDANPLDCNGHGTQVAGAAAGYGVDAAGRTAGASRPSAAARLQMTIPPGAAPGAQLFALKVFGCSGSTDAVIPALDRSLDPNGDADFSDRLDVVVLSLTSPTPVPDDPDVAVLDVVAQLGVLPVVAAGNEGDSTDAMGSPATAPRALTVAGSVGAFRRLDGLPAVLPSGENIVAAGQVSVSYPWTTAGPVTGAVVSLVDDPDGCAPLSAADAAAVAGKVAWLTWDDNDLTRSCGSAPRAANLAGAGAIGVLLTSGAPLFQAAITGAVAIPVFQLTPASTAALQPAVGHGLSVTFTDSIGTVDIDDPGVRDLLAANSSRGTHGAPYVLKPEVAAPASARPVARSGSGNAAQLGAGTSLAAAQVAGQAALVVQAHPGWTVEQVKAAVVDTAVHPVTTGSRGSGDRYGPARAGAGRVDSSDAVAAAVLAYSATNRGAVSVSFGVIEADVDQEQVTTTQSLVVQNTGATPTQLALSYAGVNSQPGVSITVSPATLTLDPGAGALATVTMTVEPASLRRTIDPTMTVQQRNSVTRLDEPRQFLPDTSGYVVVQQADAPVLQVPVYGTAKPVSSTTAEAGTVGGVAALVLTGQGFNQKSEPDPESTRYASLASVLALGYTTSSEPCLLPGRSGCRDPAGVLAGRIAAVGAGRSEPDEDAASGRLWFGVSTFGNISGLGSTYLPTVSIDTTGDRVPDFTVQVRTVGHTDLRYAYLYAGSGARAQLLSVAPLNFNSGAVDTNIFDNSVLLIPVDPQRLGLRSGAAHFPISYSVAQYAPTATSLSPVAPDSTASTATSLSPVAADSTAPTTTSLSPVALDSTGWIPFDVADPPLTTASPLWADQGGTGIPYRLGSAGAATALVLHLHGPTGGRQNIVRLGG